MANLQNKPQMDPMNSLEATNQIAAKVGNSQLLFLEPKIKEEGANMISNDTKQ